MSEQYHNDPLHGVTLQKILEALVDKFGWKRLSRIIEIRCFYNDPSVKSSLKFLRKTEWARQKVEELYVKEIAGGTRSSRPKKSPSKPTEATDMTPWFERRRQKKNEKK